MSLRTLKLSTSWGTLTLSGGSRAGEGTLLLLPQLRLALDPGRPHRALTPMTTITVSHGHADHLGGLAYWASQRFLNALGPATVLAPAELASEISDLLGIHARLEGGEPYPVSVLPVRAGSSHALRRDLRLSFFDTDHWVPTLGSLLSWQKQRLRPDLAELSGAEIARRRHAGEEVSVTETVALFAYCADSGSRLFDLHPEILDAEIVVVECSFLRDGDQDRARRYGHTHLDDLVTVAPRCMCRHLVLLHASRRHRLREVEEILEMRLAPLLQGEMHHLNVDWE